jgi:two-component system phosphate regulon sensor histidine kinase PhoR
MPKRYHQDYQDKVESHFDVSIISIPIIIIGIIMAIQLYFTNIFNESYILLFSICVVLLFISLILNDKGKLKFRLQKLILIGFAHLFAALALLLFTNPTVPYSYAWILLAVVTFEEFRRSGLLLSLVVYGGVVFGWIYTNGSIEPNATNLTLGLAQVAIVSLVSAILAQSRYLSTRELRELIRTSQSEDFEKQRLQTLINSMADAVMVVSDEGYLNQYNASLLSILDTNEQIKNKSLNQLFKLKDKHSSQVDLPRLLDNIQSVTNLELFNQISDNDQLVLNFEISPVKMTYQNSMQRGFIIIVRDITKQKSLDEERDEFISVVSHELRTPVATAEASISNLKFFLSHDDKLDKKTLRNAANEAHDQVMAISEMLSDISSLSRAEKKIDDLELKLVTAEEISSEILNNFKSKAGEKGLKLKIITPPNSRGILTSKLYLFEILSNLVSNAIKYTEAGSITVKIDDDQLNNLMISIKDTGIGLSKNDKQHIFDKYWRSEDYRTRKNGGMGLGLYVTKKLIDKIDGKLEVSSNLNKGSEFKLTLKGLN